MVALGMGQNSENQREIGTMEEANYRHKAVPGIRSRPQVDGRLRTRSVVHSRFQRNTNARQAALKQEQARCGGR